MAAPCVSLHSFSVDVSVPVNKGTVYSIADAVRGRVPRVPRRILRSVGGVIRPGTMTLVLGEPGCGKTTLLKAVAGQLGSGTSASGALRYDDLTAKDFDASRVCSYVEQSDANLPTLTVKETLELSHKFQGARGPQPATIIKELGLDNCKDTIVGNFMLRGISGGEKRRATLGEMLVGPQVGWCLDEVTTGLDSATAANIFRYLRQQTDEHMQWVVAALLQPPPDVFELFDEVIVLSAGAVAYWGPREALGSYLADIGFPTPEHVTVADWVQDVVSGAVHAAAAAGKDVEQGGIVPLADLPVTFRKSEIGQKAVPHITSTGDWLAKAQAIPRMGLLASLRLLIWRQAVVLFRNKPLFWGRVGQSMGNAAFVGSVYWNIGFNEFQSATGAFFLCLMCGAMNAMVCLPLIVLDRPVFVKQQRAKFFDPLVYLVADLLSAVPLTAAESVSFGTIVYFMAGLTDSDGYEHFFMFLLACFAFCICMAEWFKITSAIAPDAGSALPFAGLTTVCFVLQSGFVASKDSIPDAWSWMYHVSPVSWGVRLLSINQYKSSEFDEELPLEDGSTQRAGDVFLSAYGFDGEEYSYVWTCILVLLAETVVFVLLHYFFKRLFKWDSDSGGTTGAGALTIEDEEREEVELQVRSGAEDDQHAAGATFCFKDVCYTVKLGGGRFGKPVKEKQLLFSVSGVCQPGKVTALMGASGAGKTTLLDVLAGRKTHGKIEGEILINGHPKDDAVFSQVTAYVEQMDVHSHMATVAEAVEFSAALRLPASLSDAQRAAAVESTLRRLELAPLRERVVGSLSGEQLKRLTIAVELVTAPAILFLDEPTSGLDARGAALVMASIRKIADGGTTVVLTVHQPSQLIVDAFDDLLLLQRGGRTAYAGPFDGVVAHLESVAGVEPMVPGTNPSDFMLDTIGGSGASVDFAEVYAGSAPKAAAQEALQAAQQPGKQLTTAPMPGNGCGCRELFVRTARNFWRTPTYTLARYLAFVMFGLVFGTTYAGVDVTKVDQLLSQAMLMLMQLIFVGWMSQVMLMPSASHERAVFYREKPNKAYSPSAFISAVHIMEIPYVIVATLSFALIMYPLVFEWDFERFAWFWLFLALTIYLCVCFGYFLVAAMPNELLAQLGCVGGITMWALFGGVMQPADTLGAWKFLYWVSPFHYGVEGLITTQWHGDTSPVTTLFGGLDTVENQISDVLYTEFDYDNRWRNVLIMAAIILVIQVQTHWALHKVNHQKR